MLPLSGYVIGVTGHRRAAEQAEMYVKRGASVMIGSVMQSVPLDDIDATIAATRRVVTEPVDIIVLTTGVGTRTWVGIAEMAGLDEELRVASNRVLVLARGPKARSAAIGAGLDVAWQAPGETGVEIIEYLSGVGVRGKLVVVQRDGGVDLPGSLSSAIAGLGAEVIEVPVYRWRLPDDVQPARKLIAAVFAERVDAVTFTSAIAVDNFFELAPDEDAIAAVLSGPVITVSVGPVTADALRRHGVERVIEPPRARLGSMVQTVVEVLEALRQDIVYGGVSARLQGLALSVGGGPPLTLTIGEARMLHLLLKRAPSVVAKSELVDLGADGHAAEMAIARLRTKLGSLGAGIVAVPRRGYRCELDVAAVAQ